jgi:DNA-binding beta-propeller fold protein YncE
MHDHTGSFSRAIAGVNTVELQVADNDYAVGLVAEKIAHSPCKHNTLIFVIEDDAQDGADHIDAHRSIAFVIGPYVKHNAVVSTPYNTISMVRTIEDILGIKHMNLNDTTANPMLDVFDVDQKHWTYHAAPSDLLYSTQLPLPALAAGHKVLHPIHDAAYWEAATKGMDFSVAAHVNGQQFNRIVWQGLMGGKPYPSSPSGLDLRINRQQLLDRYRTNPPQQPVHSADSSAGNAGGQ